MRLTKEERFDQLVVSKYQVYNNIFMTLPFDTISKTGVLLPLFQEVCEDGYAQQKNPSEIVASFFNAYVKHLNEQQKTDLLFRFIQYIERQVVLFDAIEEASFSQINNMEGRGTLRNVKEEAQAKNKSEALHQYLQKIKIRPVLTAHPTQFYPGNVLGIITDLAQAINKNKFDEIKLLLAQLGKTPFLKKEKPTPFDEAVSLIWYLENVFYHAISSIYNYIQNNILEGQTLNNRVINLGFWPGGDRDGNPFVTSETTLEVAQRLKQTLLKNYYKDLRKIRRRITFNKVEDLLIKLEQKVYQNIVLTNKKENITASYLKSQLNEIKTLLINEHQSLFLDLIQDLINKVELFGVHFASLDIRQDSRVHTAVINSIAKDYPKLFPENYQKLKEEEKIEFLSKVTGHINPKKLEDEMAQKTISSILAMKTIQKQNGEMACNRYIISNNGSVVNILEVFAMIRMCDWNNPTVDIIPLFETINDLEVAHKVMETLYKKTEYRKHLNKRKKIQTIMLGFSDGTKDGGYLMANWSIYTAKERLTAISRKYGITALFFDGRGGPPARGGGKTHQFYASLGHAIEHQEVQLTIQGQTISSNFGTIDSCQYNLEQLLSSGISNEIFTEEASTLSQEDRETMQLLAQISYNAYSQFKSHEKFVPYLEHMSTLKYYAKTNIGSRPSKRGRSDQLIFSDLRAIPFVGSWSQLKQNVPGFFGVGTALQHFIDQDNFVKVQQLYQNSLFFKTLLENSMMSLTKSFFPLTAYMKDDPEYAAFWQIIYDEYLRTKALLLKLTGYNELMEDSKAMRASIKVREKIVLPLLTIQQYALMEINALKNTKVHNAKIEVLEKMVTRSLFGNINAARNSA